MAEEARQRAIEKDADDRAGKPRQRVLAEQIGRFVSQGYALYSQSTFDATLTRHNPLGGRHGTFEHVEVFVDKDCIPHFKT